MLELNKIHHGTCLELIAQLPDSSIDSVITSPPYWQLRDYGWNGQWGLEPTYQMYLENLWSLMNEVYRVLKPTGTAWINLGDTYGIQSGGMRIAQDNFETQNYKYGALPKPVVQPKTLHKCLLLIPHRFAIGCIDLGFIIRNDIVWAKRNGMPESVTDRFSKKHEYFFFMTKSEKYYFDLDGIRDKLRNPVEIRNKASEIYGRGSGNKQFSEGVRIWGDEDKGKNPGSVADFWDVPTKPSKSNHFATYNTDLIDKPIIAGCPKEGIILDPFAGTGTTLIRAHQLGRQTIGFEGSEAYCAEANKAFSVEKSQLKLFA